MSYLFILLLLLLLLSFDLLQEEYYHKSLDEIRSSLDHSQNELMTLAKKYSSLENEYRHNHALRESSENELAVLREEHHLVKGNLTSTVKVKKALEEKMESLQKQMDESMELLVEKVGVSDSMCYTLVSRSSILTIF